MVDRTIRTLTGRHRHSQFGMSEPQHLPRPLAMSEDPRRMTFVGMDLGAIELRVIQHCIADGTATEAMVDLLAQRRVEG